MIVVMTSSRGPEFPHDVPSKKSDLTMCSNRFFQVEDKKQIRNFRIPNVS